MVRVDPMSGGGANKPPALAALEQELQRGMRELGGKGKPPPYYIAYEVHDRNDVTVAASYGALVQSSMRQARILDTDVRVGSYKLDSTHTIRSSDFDFSSMSGAATPCRCRWRTIRWRCAPSRGARPIAATERRPSGWSRSGPRDVEGRRRRSLGRLLAREAGRVHRAAAALAIDVPGWERRIRAAVGPLSRAGRDAGLWRDAAGEPA